MASASIESPAMETGQVTAETSRSGPTGQIGQIATQRPPRPQVPATHSVTGHARPHLLMNRDTPCPAELKAYFEG